MSSRALLIVPACERGLGGGHLGRSLFLFQALQKKGRAVYLWIPENLKDDVISRFAEFFRDFDNSRDPANGENSRFLSRKEELSGRVWDFIILDRFRTPAFEFTFWASLGPLVGIDEGGPRRNRFDFLMDLLPSLAGPEPNITAPGLLPLPRARVRGRDFSPAGKRPAGRNTPAESGGAPSEKPIRILISFGAEDAAGLGFSAARALIQVPLKKPRKAPPEKGASPHDITLIAPPGDNSDTELRERGVRITGKLPGLRERLAEYDLFITHFGLGAFEALYAGVPVLLVSPTVYHERLSRNAGFFSLGLGPKAFRRLAELKLNSELLESLGQRGRETARRFGLEEDQKEDLGAFMSGLTPRFPGNCPVCGKTITPGGAPPVLARFPEETYRRCKHCASIYLGRLKAPPVEYGKEYFFDSYKKQYGKTYLEDFPGLKEMGRKRLTHIRSLLLSCPAEGTAVPAEKSFPEGAKLLDIGCAYGPFLAAAAECGFSPMGLEPAGDAVLYVKEELGFPVRQGFFPLPQDEGGNAGSSSGGETFADGSFDAVTLWYVIEHFEEPGKVLSEIHRLLKRGGVLAFSTPSFSGVSGRKNLRSFLKDSPPDHWTIWSPFFCGKIFKKYGFRLCKIVVTGHHPERFPLLGRFVSPLKKGPLYRLLFLASRLFRLGDTFEAYGVKTTSPP